MKRSKICFLVAWLALMPVAMGQQRIIPHVTRIGGGFATQIIVANTTDFTKNYQFTAYDNSGNILANVSGDIDGATTIFRSVEDMFGVPEISHFVISDASDVTVTVVYQQLGDNTVPAHVNESKTSSTVWRIYPANTTAAWDGVAVVNRGTAPTSVTVTHADKDGMVINTTTPDGLSNIPSMGKGLYVISSDFDMIDDSYYEMSSDQATAITSLRGDLGGGGLFLWENTPIAVSSDAMPGMSALITAVDVSGSLITVHFAVFEDGLAFPGLTASSVRFTAAKLVGASNGNSSTWQSYINTIQDVANPASGWPEPVGNPGTGTAVQATYERGNTEGGTYVDHGDGTYSYTFSFDFAAVADPIEVSFDPAATHRVAMQYSGNTNNPAFDFVPNGAAVTQTHDVAALAACNSCHGDLTIHGSRKGLEYCVTCHNPGSSDPHSEQTVDLKVMAHKIHMGKHLPSVVAGGEYAIWGYQNSKHDYSDVGYPQPLNNCVKCHDGTPGAVNQTANGDNWKNFPTAEACGSCHDDVDYAAGVNHLAQADNTLCAQCHPASAIMATHSETD